MPAPSAPSNIDRMRKSRSVQVSVAVTALQTVLVPRSDNRVVISFVSNTTTRYTVSLIQSVGNVVGHSVPGQGTGLTFNMAEHGDMVRGPWFITGGTIPDTFTYIETLLDSP